jgi:hypothetical protein
MDKIYDLLKLNIDKGLLQNLHCLVPQIKFIILKNNLVKELDQNKLINWSDNFYNKIKINNYSSKEFEMFVISWLPKQSTPIYDHPQYGSIFCVLAGTIEEKIYNKKLDLIETNIIKGPYVGFIDNSIGYHSLKCLDKAVSLHIYSPSGYKPFLMSV